MTPKPPIFKPEDFQNEAVAPWSVVSFHQAAEIANRIIESKLGPKVYGYIGEHGSSWSSDKPGTYIQENNTHTAYLFDTQKLPEKECEHEPEFKTYTLYGIHSPSYPIFGRTKCKHCNVELTARWEAKK